MKSYQEKTQRLAKEISTSIKITIPSGTVVLGAGTVPTSGSSVYRTRANELSRSLNEASRLKIFDKVEEEYGSKSQAE